MKSQNRMKGRQMLRRHAWGMGHGWHGSETRVGMVMMVCFADFLVGFVVEEDEFWRIAREDTSTSCRKPMESVEVFEMCTYSRQTVCQKANTTWAGRGCRKKARLGQ